MNYADINLTKYIKEDEETYKTLMNEIKELSEWRETTCSWIGRLDIAISVLFNSVDRVGAIPTKLQQVVLWIAKPSSLHGEAKGQTC